MRVEGARRRWAIALVGLVALAWADGAAAQSYPLSDPLDPSYQQAGGAASGADAAAPRAGAAAEAQQTGASAAQTQVAAQPGITAPDQITDDGSVAGPDAAGYGTRTTRRRLQPLDDTDQTGELQPRLVQPVRPSPPSEFETYVSQIADKPLRRFGAQLLIPTARDFIAPPTTAVPADYRLNPGDELVIGLIGSIQAANLRLTISPDGTVFIPRVGAVPVGGVRYGDLQAVLARAISRQYRSFSVSVSVGRLHSITVYVTGFAQTPGSYTVSSLSTIVNAVLAAGGPSPGGSFRSIQLKRDGKLVSNFDLYDLLLRGDKSKDVILQDGDVIFVAPAGAQAAVIGSVNNEAIFEARPGETVQDLLVEAGGVNTVADEARALLLDPLRTDNGGWQELTPAQARLEPVRRGEVIRVLSGVGIARPLDQQAVLVTVSGEVAHPGRYYMQPGIHMADVIARAGGLTSQAYVFGSVVTRESVRDQQRISFDRAIRDLDFQLSAGPLVHSSRDYPIQPARVEQVQSVINQLRLRRPDGRLLLNVAPTATALPGDLQMENNDTVYVPPVPVTVSVFGSVPSSGAFRFRPGETLGQVLEDAGGVQKLGDKSQIFVIRANGMVLTRKKGALKQAALPGDLIFVPIDGQRGETWDHIRDLTNLVFTGALSAATTIAVTK